MAHEVGSLNSFSGTNTTNTSTRYRSERLENERTYDSAFKNFFKRKEVLAILLREVVDEFKYKPLTLIERSIITSDVNALNAETLSEEDTTFSSKVLYDVVVHCKTEETELEANLIFDLEMQRNYKMPYEILDRAVYYASRLLAKQSVANSSYNKLIPVHSTWICLNGIPKHLQNSVHFLKLEDSNYENPVAGKSLINVSLLLLSEDYDWDVEDAYLIKFLQSIFKNRLNDKEFNPDLEVTDEMEKEALAIKLEQEQHEAEMAYSNKLSREEGKEEGREEGIAIGLAKGTIRTLLNLNYTDEQILGYLIKNNGLTEVDAAYYLDLVKNE